MNNQMTMSNDMMHAFSFMVKEMKPYEEIMRDISLSKKKTFKLSFPHRPFLFSSHIK